ncbi:hypothetical protein BD779DRAFT_436079 [Infundibulicybe gibba]|nr:hypothetical protein BD779DRAFT_436079 [Infundibulicybe gibba]
MFNHLLLGWSLGFVGASHYRRGRRGVIFTYFCSNLQTCMGVLDVLCGSPIEIHSSLRQSSYGVLEAVPGESDDHNPDAIQAISRDHIAIRQPCGLLRDLVDNIGQHITSRALTTVNRLDQTGTIPNYTSAGGLVGRPPKYLALVLPTNAPEHFPRG